MECEGLSRLDQEKSLGITGKRNKPEQTITRLREAEVELVKGQSVGAMVRKLGITEQMHYR